MAGYSDRKPIELPMNWNSEFVLSGMYVNGKNLWRITPNTDAVSKEAFKVEGAAPTFSVTGQTITFPGGKIIADGNISVVGTCGYWVETAKDVTPIVTNDADRFTKVPAYTEDFESYKVGTQLTTMNIRDENGWIVMQPKGNPITVEADGENQLVSMTGNAMLKNKQIPANVTAADSYAMEQVWSLTPQNLPPIPLPHPRTAHLPTVHTGKNIGLIAVIAAVAVAIVAIVVVLVVTKKKPAKKEENTEE